MNETCVGTIKYMAPEVYLHKPYTTSCDIWALGIIFYEMAMLSYPFTNAVSFNQLQLLKLTMRFYIPATSTYYKSTIRIHTTSD